MFFSSSNFAYMYLTVTTKSHYSATAHVNLTSRTVTDKTLSTDDKPMTVLYNHIISNLNCYIQLLQNLRHNN